VGLLSDLVGSKFSFRLVWKPPSLHFPSTLYSSWEFTTPFYRLRYLTVCRPSSLPLMLSSFARPGPPMIATGTPLCFIGLQVATVSRVPPSCHRSLICTLSPPPSNFFSWLSPRSCLASSLDQMPAPRFHRLFLLHPAPLHIIRPSVPLFAFQPSWSRFPYPTSSFPSSSMLKDTPPQQFCGFIFIGLGCPTHWVVLC